jgi:Zn-dependent M28 family amino/carboxypeptidase
MTIASRLGAIGAVATASLTLGAGIAGAATQTDTSALEAATNVGTLSNTPDPTTGLARHLKMWQTIADANDNNRATGSSGHEASAKYVFDTLAAAGYQPRYQNFIATVFSEVTDPTFARTAPTQQTYVNGTDYLTMEFSPSGSVLDTPLVAIDYTPPTNQASASTSGCEATDFPPETAGKIALIQRGTCDFIVKAQNAQAAGAVAAVIYNEGTTGDANADRRDLLNGTLGANTLTIPVVGTTYEVGNTLRTTAGARATVITDTKVDNLPTKNVIVDTPGRADRTVVVGAHLDSVPEGPGVNDDGSGSATDLEIALQMKRLGIKPYNRVRFIWFSGEEQGLLGSQYYVDQLSKREVNDHLAMLDFDMLGSPNWGRFVYDGDGSDGGPAGPAGSGVVERVFSEWYAARGLYFETDEFDGRSDYDGFTAAGIPAGGITTGADGVKTHAQWLQWGGIEGAIYDQCYHQLCDSYPANIDAAELDNSVDAVAHAVGTFAMSTSSINGTGNGSTKSFDYEGNYLKR